MNATDAPQHPCDGCSTPCWPGDLYHGLCAECTRLADYDPDDDSHEVLQCDDCGETHTRGDLYRVIDGYYCEGCIRGEVNDGD